MPELAKNVPPVRKIGMARVDREEEDSPFV